MGNEGEEAKIKQRMVRNYIDCVIPKVLLHPTNNSSSWFKLLAYFRPFFLSCFCFPSLFAFHLLNHAWHVRMKGICRWKPRRIEESVESQKFQSPHCQSLLCSFLFYDNIQLDLLSRLSVFSILLTSRSSKIFTQNRHAFPIVSHLIVAEYLNEALGAIQNWRQVSFWASEICSRAFLCVCLWLFMIHQRISS